MLTDGLNIMQIAKLEKFKADTPGKITNAIMKDWASDIQCEYQSLKDFIAFDNNANNEDTKIEASASLEVEPLEEIVKSLKEDVVALNDAVKSFVDTGNTLAVAITSLQYEVSLVSKEPDNTEPDKKEPDKKEKKEKKEDKK